MSEYGIVKGPFGDEFGDSEEHMLPLWIFGVEIEDESDSDPAELWTEPEWETGTEE